VLHGPSKTHPQRQLSEALVAFKAGRPVSKHHLNKLAELGLVKPHRGGRRLTRLGERLAALIEEA